jgi:hypothetical protein
VRVGRALLAAAGVAGAAAAAWNALVRFQGDSEVGFGPATVGNPVVAGSLHVEVELVNRGKEGCAIRRVNGRIVDGLAGRVIVTRKGSRPPERGWWVSNVLKAGDTCVAEVDVELVEPGPGPVVVELDAEEVGRRLMVHRTTRLTLAPPATADARP